MANGRSVLLVGGPDAGKSLFLGSLWLCLREGGGSHRLEGDPADIRYVNGIADSLLRGKYVPRTNIGEDARDFEVKLVDSDDVRSALVVPDVDGELWKKASENRELPNTWIDRLHSSSAALLFVRVGSSEFVPMMDWVASAEAMREPMMKQFSQEERMPTQVFLTDLINVLDEHLGVDETEAPRVALIVSAWDLLPPEDADFTPAAYLEREYPMLAGRLRETGRLNVRVFGVSAIGGDLEDANHLKAFQDNPGTATYSVVENDGGGSRALLTAPVDWTLGDDC
jgi:hypothetical protein